jgi:hypothetical protein
MISHHLAANSSDKLNEEQCCSQADRNDASMVPRQNENCDLCGSPPVGASWHRFCHDVMPQPTEVAHTVTADRLFLSMAVIDETSTFPPAEVPSAFFHIFFDNMQLRTIFQGLYMRCHPRGELQA